MRFEIGVPRDPALTDCVVPQTYVRLGLIEKWIRWQVNRMKESYFLNLTSLISKWNKQCLNGRSTVLNGLGDCYIVCWAYSLHRQCKLIFLLWILILIKVKLISSRKLIVWITLDRSKDEITFMKVQ